MIVQNNEPDGWRFDLLLYVENNLEYFTKKADTSPRDYIFDDVEKYYIIEYYNGQQIDNEQIEKKSELLEKAKDILKNQKYEMRQLPNNTCIDYATHKEGEISLWNYINKDIRICYNTDMFNNKKFVTDFRTKMEYTNKIAPILERDKDKLCKVFTPGKYMINNKIQNNDINTIINNIDKLDEIENQSNILTANINAYRKNMNNKVKLNGFVLDKYNCTYAESLIDFPTFSKLLILANLQEKFASSMLKQSIAGDK
jgi:hypothetical protein